MHLFSSELDDFFAEGFGNGFGFRMDFEFAVNAFDMATNRFFTNKEGFGYEFIAASNTQVVQNFHFARRKKAIGFFLEGTNNHAGYLGTHGRSAFVNFFDGFKQTGRCGVFYQVSAGSGAE